jgi:hypothetical protein
LVGVERGEGEGGGEGEEKRVVRRGEGEERRVVRRAYMLLIDPTCY